MGGCVLVDADCGLGVLVSRLIRLFDYLKGSFMLSGGG